MRAGWRIEADPDATEPTGMCGSPTKCKQCPSDYLCWQKAKDEAELIARRKASPEPAR